MNTRLIRCVEALVILALATIPRTALAQGCCTPGSSPLGGIVGGPTKRWSVELGTALDVFELDQGYEGTEKFDDPRYSRVLSNSFFTRIGLSTRFLLIVEVPIDNRMRRQELNTPTGTKTFEFNNTALGDISTLMMARVLPWSGLGRTSLNVGIGVKWPTGVDDATQDTGLRIPFELQVGTGSYDPLAALSASRLFGWGNVVFAGTVRHPTEASTGYRFGLETNSLLQLDWNVGSWWLGPQFRGRYASEDKFRGRTVINTGGHRVMVGAQVSKQFASPGLVLLAAWLIPAYQNLEGRQLGVSQQFVVAINWRVR